MTTPKTDDAAQFPECISPGAPSSKTKTGEAVKGVVEAVKADLSSIEGHLTAALAEITTLEEAAKGINGLKATCAGWRNQLTDAIRQVREERADVVSKLTGAPKAEIKQSVDDTLAERVKAAREEQAA